MPKAPAPATFLDRAIGYFSPQRGHARVVARRRLEAVTEVKALYEAASVGRRTQGWRSTNTDANAEIRMAGARLREVARDMIRNNAYAMRAKTTIAHNVIGAGVIAQVKAARPDRRERVAELINRHFDSADIDADGLLNLYGLQELAMKTVVESGEVLIRRRPRRPEDGLALPFQLQVLEPDFLDTSVQGPLANGNWAEQGVEFDLRGKRVAYYLFDQHPGNGSIGAGWTSQGKRVSADFVAHVYRVDRPGQVRGVTWFAPVIVRMRDFADYADAQLLRQKIAACFAAFVYSDGDVPDIGQSTTGVPLEQFEPGMIERLRAGEKIEFATPPTTQDFGSYSRITLQEISAGLNIPYEALTNDLSNVNYSSGRMGWLEYQRNIESWRWNMLIPQMLDPISRWTYEAARVVTASSEPFTLGWTPPRREMIDPAVEIKASRDAVRAGLSWPSNEMRRFGFDPEDVYTGWIEDMRRMDDDGLVFDSDPRRTTVQGVSQRTEETTDAAQPA